jgi:hypothetical protein
MLGVDMTSKIVLLAAFVAATVACAPQTAVTQPDTPVSPAAQPETVTIPVAPEDDARYIRNSAGYRSMEKLWKKQPEQNRDGICNTFAEYPDEMWKDFREQGGAGLLTKKQYTTFFNDHCE